MEILLPLLALALGAFVAWIAAAGRRRALEADLARAQADLAGRDARLDEKERALVQQRELLEATQQRQQDAFARAAQDALAKNSESFLRLTSERLAPFKESLTKLEQNTRALEEKRERAYGGLSMQLSELSRSTAELKSSSESLATALRGSSQARGRFGELQLRNLVDAAGMLSHVDFVEQRAQDNGTRPDMIIKLPEGDGIPVDAKLPLAAYWSAVEAKDPLERKRCFKQHADDLKRHVAALAKRDYSSLVPGRIDYTVLFLSGDPLLSAAYEENPDLFDEAVRQRVLIATPVTFMALLRTARVLWTHKAMAENARAVSEAAGELYKRIAAFGEHVVKVGENLERATTSYNAAVGSFQSRVLPAGRKVEELGAAPAGSELPQLKAVAGELRALPKETN